MKVINQLYLNKLVRKLFLLNLFISNIYSTNLHVEINNHIYDYLHRLSVQGLLPNYLDATLPLTRNYIFEILIDINQSREKLSMIDRDILDNYLIQYDTKNLSNDEEGIFFLPINSKQTFIKSFKDLLFYSKNQKEPHFMIYEKNKNLVWFDIGSMIRYETKNSFNRLPFNYNYSLSILLDDNVVVYSDADIYSMVFNDEYNENPKEFRGGFPLYREGFYGYSNEMSFEYAHAYIQYTSDYGNFALRAEPIIWGNGRNSILLSNNVPPFPMLSWDKNIGNSRFTFFHGSILPSSPNESQDGLIVYGSKYLVGHRWEIATGNKFEFAFTEMLVYGGRDPELMYFLPTIFLWPVQHNMTSQSEDNILWFFEGSYNILDRFSMYGTFMIDELNTKEMFKKYYGNRWAFQVGISMSDNIFSFPSFFRLEWTAARPWAYTHRLPQYGTYTHNSRCMGFKYGPNSQLLFAENIWWISMRSKLSFIYEYLRWGVKPVDELENSFSFGNNSNDSYLDADPKYYYETGWLIGDIKSRYELGINFEYKISNLIDLELLYSYGKNENSLYDKMSFQVNFNY